MNLPYLVPGAVMELPDDFQMASTASSMVPARWNTEELPAENDLNNRFRGLAFLYESQLTQTITNIVWIVRTSAWGRKLRWVPRVAKYYLLPASHHQRRNAQANARRKVTIPSISTSDSRITIPVTFFRWFFRIVRPRDSGETLPEFCSATLISPAKLAQPCSLLPHDNALSALFFPHPPTKKLNSNSSTTSLHR